jgi:hypothetical protein
MRILLGAGIADEQRIRPPYELARDRDIDGCFLLVPCDHPHLRIMSSPQRSAVHVQSEMHLSSKICRRFISKSMIE